MGIKSPRTAQHRAMVTSSKERGGLSVQLSADEAAISPQRRCIRSKT